MKSRALLSLAALAIASSAPAQDIVTPEAWLVDALETLCYKPFGDVTNVDTAIASFKAKTEFKKLEHTPGSVQAGTTWEAPKASLNYTDAAWLPRDLPSPQCTLTSDVGKEFSHAAAVAIVERRLPVGRGKTRGKGSRWKTEWNFVSSDRAKRRLFLSSGPAGNGIQATASLLNIRN
jgi:hypothetical protein